MSHPPNTRSSRFASGTKSLMSGVRPSVRLPSRTVASCVSDPIGAPSPRFTASTPATKVVQTAPMPGISTPSLPVAGAMVTLSFFAALVAKITSGFFEAGGKIAGEVLLRMQFLRALEQHRFGLGNFRIGDAAIDRTHRRALLLIEKAHALGALVRHDVIDVLLDRVAGLAVELPWRAAFVNRGVGAFGLARAAV